VGQSLFIDQVPSLPNENDSTRYTLCTLVIPGINGLATHGRWYLPQAAPSRPPVWAMWQRNTDALPGPLLASAVFDLSAYAPGWRTVPLVSPVPMLAGVEYYLGVKTENRYVASPGLFVGSAVVNGFLTAPADDLGAPRRNGRFNDFGEIDEPNYPDDGGGACYFADLVFEPDTGAPPVPATLSSRSATAGYTSATAAAGLTELTRGWS
jgi:hypothetical protein